MHVYNKKYNLLDWAASLYLVFLGSIFLFLNSKKFFYGDDYSLIYNHIADSPIKFLNFFAKTETGGLFYRPLTNVFYGLNYFLFGLNPLGYYFINILLYLLSLFFLYKIVDFVAKNKTIAFISIVLFLLYFPANSGVLSIINNLATALQGFFFLSSFYFYLIFSSSTSKKQAVFHYLFSLILFLCGMLSKESALMLIFLLLIHDLIFRKESFKILGFISRLAPYILITAVVLIIKTNIGALYPFTEATGDYYRYCLGLNIIKHFFYYSAFLLVPFLILFVSLLLIRLLNRQLKYKPIDPTLFVFGFSWFFINMLPYLPFKTGEQLGWMYLSSMGLTFPLAYFAFDTFKPFHDENRPKFYKVLILSSLLILVIFLTFCFVFLPGKYFRRIKIDGYARNIFNEARVVYPYSAKNANLYLIDETEDVYNLKNIFTSADVSAAFKLLLKETPPENVFIVNKIQLKKIRRSKNDIFLLYKDHKILVYGKSS